MNKTEMADRLAARTGLSKSAAKEAVDSVFAAIGGALANGEEVRIAGFGAFGTRSRPARTGRNPKTGEAVSIGASTSPTFKAGKRLWDTFLPSIRDRHGKSRQVGLRAGAQSNAQKGDGLALGKERTNVMRCPRGEGGSALCPGEDCTSVFVLVVQRQRSRAPEHGLRHRPSLFFSIVGFTQVLQETYYRRVSAISGQL